MRRAHLRGAGLVEVMISMVLGLLLLAGLFQIYLSTGQSQRLQDAVVRRQEAIRYATLMMTRDLRMAGYRGCLRDVGLVRNTLNNAANYPYNFALPVQGFDASGGSWSPALDASLAPVVPGTDVLSVRTTFDPGVYIRQRMPISSADLKVTDNLSQLPFAAGGGDIVLITDCGGAAVFQITQYTAVNGNVVHNVGTTLVPGNATKDLGRRFDVGSEIIRIATVSYFIRNSDTGSGPALWRSIGSAAPEELVEGIENLQVEYGEDTDGDQVPDVYRRASQVADWRSVTTIRAALLAAGTERALDRPDPRSFAVLGETVGPFADKKLRRVITVTVGLRNRLP